MVMKINLKDEKVSKFSFTLSSKELDQSINKVSSALSFSPGANNAKNFFLAALKGKVVLIAFSPDTYIYIVLQSGKADKDGIFGFNQATLQGIIKGRADMKFNFTGTECEFGVLKGNYSGTIVTLPITSDQTALINNTFGASKKKDESSEGSVLPRAVLDILKEGVKLTSLSDVYTGSKLLSYMTLNTKGVLNVSVFDQHHFGHFKSELDAGGITFKAALPSTHFDLIDKLIEGEEASFYIRAENIKVEGDNFVLILPSTQTEDKNYTLISEFLKDLAKPSFSCAYDNEALSIMTDNLFTLHSANTSFDLSHKEGSNKLSVTFKTLNGSASDTLKINPSKSKSLKVKIDPRILKDLLNLVKGHEDTTLSVVPDKVCVIKSKTKSGSILSLVGTLAG